METGWFRKAKRMPQLMTTYRIGLVQAKAYRILNARTAELLEPLGVRPLDWALMGLLKDHPEGMSPGALAEELGVKAPHVSAQLTRLKQKDLVYDCVKEEDKRQKCVGLTDAGHRFLPETEKLLREGMRDLVTGATLKDVLAYVHVLGTIGENGSD